MVLWAEHAITNTNILPIHTFVWQPAALFVVHRVLCFFMRLVFWVLLGLMRRDRSHVLCCNEQTDTNKPQPPPHSMCMLLATRCKWQLILSWVCAGVLDCPHSCLGWNTSVLNKNGQKDICSTFDYDQHNLICDHYKYINLNLRYEWMRTSRVSGSFKFKLEFE